MQILKQIILFYMGGAGYMFLEFLWRGRSHGSMFLLGGLCFLLIGRIWKTLGRIPPAVRLVLSAVLVTALELFTGVLVNRDYRVWDYRKMPLQFGGQICLSYSLLWIPVSFLAAGLYCGITRWLDKRIAK